jgi:hypothetical protein
MSELGGKLPFNGHPLYVVFAAKPTFRLEAHYIRKRPETDLQLQTKTATKSHPCNNYAAFLCLAITSLNTLRFAPLPLFTGSLKPGIYYLAQTPCVSVSDSPAAAAPAPPAAP